MSKEYDEYLRQHKANVAKGYEWMHANLKDSLEPGFFDNDEIRLQICEQHDASKRIIDEYRAYDSYFYGGTKSSQVVDNFNKAFLLHLHRNPHHWNYWVLRHDDPEEYDEAIKMPYRYIIEMICDWWSFSWQKGDLTEIFRWYDEHKYHMKLHKDTRKEVDSILDIMKIKLGSEGVLNE